MDYLVSCNHTVAKYRRTDLFVTVSTDRQGEGRADRYYVSIPGFGCSRSYATRYDAIVGMLQEHACFDIKVKAIEPDPEPEAMNEYRRSGQETRLRGHDRYYGCHFGMRSTRDWAMAEFFAGWDEIDAALGAASGLPTMLNGHPVIRLERHANCTTVMVERDPNHLPYVVATWAPHLGSTWSWGHYCIDRDEADAEFAATAARNGAR